MSFERPASRTPDRDTMPSIPSQTEAEKLRNLRDEAPLKPLESGDEPPPLPIPNPVEL